MLLLVALKGFMEAEGRELINSLDDSNKNNTMHDLFTASITVRTVL
jgi:hypothetical protein